MRILKKIGVLTLVFALVLSFAACTKTGVEKFVDERGRELEETIEGRTSGIDCEVEADGNDLIVRMKSAEFNDLSDEQKEEVKEAFSDLQDEYRDLIVSQTDEIEGLETVIYEICDSEGNVVVDFKFEVK